MNEKLVFWSCPLALLLARSRKGVEWAGESGVQRKGEEEVGEDTETECRYLMPRDQKPGIGSFEFHR